MLIKKLVLQNFRCFQALELSLQGRCVVIQGNNGIGKSSVLEALHYSCYLKSFRTHVHRDLVKLGEDHFFLRVHVEQEMLGTSDYITVGYTAKEGKLVKQNDKPIQSYKELIANYRLVTLAADDLSLVHGAPEGRRDFLNYALFLLNPGLLAHFKRYRQILDQRNAMLLAGRNSFSKKVADDLEVWSYKLWEESRLIRRERITYLALLEGQVNELLKRYFAQTDADISVNLHYIDKVKQETECFHTFWGSYAQKQLEQECVLGRSLFGIHLDDFSITFQSKKARVFASRGQQKLIVFLLKVAQLLELGLMGEPGVLLLDDFLTDFDDRRIQECFAALCALPFQIIVTCPTQVSVLGSGLAQSSDIGGFSVISL